MESVFDFLSIHSVFNFFCYQPFFKKRKFFVAKIIQILILISGLTLFYVYRDFILYSKDGFGRFADNYRLFVSVLVIFMIIFESLFRYNDYDAILKFCRLYENILKANFKHQFDISVTYRRLQRNFKVGSIFFLLFYIVCEFKYLELSFDKSQTRLFYLAFLMPTVLFGIKAFQLVFFISLFSSYLKILRKLMRNLNLEVISNQRIKSNIYDSIIRKKLSKIISMHYFVVKMIDNFNSSMGLSQLGIMLAFKFYLYGDFYWISFVIFHRQIKLRLAYGELIDVCSFISSFLTILQSFLWQRYQRLYR